MTRIVSDARPVLSVEPNQRRGVLAALASVSLVALVAGCANSGAVTLQQPQQDSQPVIVTSGTTPTTPIEVTVPSTIPRTTTTTTDGRSHDVDHHRHDDDGRAGSLSGDAAHVPDPDASQGRQW